MSECHWPNKVMGPNLCQGMGFSFSSEKASGKEQFWKIIRYTQIAKLWLCASPVHGKEVITSYLLFFFFFGRKCLMIICIYSDKAIAKTQANDLWSDGSQNVPDLSSSPLPIRNAGVCFCMHPLDSCFSGLTGMSHRFARFWFVSLGLAMMPMWPRIGHHRGSTL